MSSRASFGTTTRPMERIGTPMSTKSSPNPTAIADTPIATTDVNSDARRNEPFIATSDPPRRASSETVIRSAASVWLTIVKLAIPATHLVLLSSGLSVRRVDTAPSGNRR